MYLIKIIVVYNKHFISNNCKKISIKDNKVIIFPKNKKKLPSEKAIKLERCLYFDHFSILMKEKNIILITFYKQNNYNLLPLKISLFVLIFCFIFSINISFKLVEISIELQ